MSTPVSEREILIRISVNHDTVTGNAVPLLLLADVMKGVQRTINAIGVSLSNREPPARGRVPLEVQKACELFRVLERSGSYEMIARVPEAQPVLFEKDLGKEAIRAFYQVVAAVSGDDPAERLGQLIPDRLHRKRIVRSLEDYCPRPGDAWDVSFATAERAPEARLTSATKPKITRLLTTQETKQLTVTGELVRVHLDEHKLAILYPPTGRVLDCYYQPELEEFVIDNLKALIHVTGTVQLNRHDYPDKIVDVSEIAEVDLRPLRLKQVKDADLVLTLRKPLELTPFFEDQQVYFHAPDLNLLASGYTRDEAVAEFESNLVWLWREYAAAAVDELSRDGNELRDRLQQLIEAVGA